MAKESGSRVPVTGGIAARAVTDDTDRATEA
jgi:hypothetical protein